MHYSLFDYILTTILIISLSVYFQKSTPLYLKIFPVYFLGALTAALREEWLGQHGQYNTGVANVWGIIEFCFFFFVLREIIVGVKIKRIILFVSIVFALFAFINIFFIQKNVGFNPVNFTIGCLITVLACIYYFIELFQKTEAESLSRLPAFWIASGILFNTILSFPLFALITFLQISTKVNKATQLLYRNIDSIVNITVLLTMLLFAIGFLCRFRIRKSA
jgi:hypothetical protein